MCSLSDQIIDFIHLSAQTLLKLCCQRHSNTHTRTHTLRGRHLPIMPCNRFVAMEAFFPFPPVPCSGSLRLIQANRRNRYDRADPVGADPPTRERGMQRRQVAPEEDRDAPRQTVDSSMAAAAERERRDPAKHPRPSPLIRGCT
ncbi:Hypothetical predicted protein [Xyrichtys novacula]|uniref:Uncharacterized protein n=1 Tax=Xyrichtys novacula TaxID=13765 RepID=A0AAV1HM20_XYRNO|nr:Hypothetical predicted protein [Xyrichtys novacula]